MIVALWAAIAMVLSDCISAVLTMAQARDRAVLAGWLDTAGWLVAIFTTSWSVAAVNGHDLAKKVAVLGAVSLANWVGSWLGVKIGERWVRQAGMAPQSARLDALELWAQTAGYRRPE